MELLKHFEEDSMDDSVLGDAAEYEEDKSDLACRIASLDVGKICRYVHNIGIMFIVFVANRLCLIRSTLDCPIACPARQILEGSE